MAEPSVRKDVLKEAQDLTFRDEAEACFWEEIYLKLVGSEKSNPPRGADLALAERRRRLKR